MRVYQPEGQPPPGFVPVVTTLEDAYLVLIKTGFLNGLDTGWVPREAHGHRSERRSCSATGPGRPRWPMTGALTASLRRFSTVFLENFTYQSRRPLFIIWAVILGLTAWGMSSGAMQIRSGDATMGGTKAHVTSEFAVAMQFSVVTLLFSGFFVAVAAGMAVIQDDQWRIGDLLHSTSLRPGEYIWAKFAAVLAACATILLFNWRR